MLRNTSLQSVESLLPPFALHNLNQAFINGTKEDELLIKDIITLLNHCAAENRAGNEPLCLISLPDGSVFVSGQIYQWSLRFNAVITSKSLIKKMKSAVEYNCNVLQPKINDYSTAVVAYNAKRTEAAYQFEFIARQHKGLDGNATLESYKEFLQKNDRTNFIDNALTNELEAIESFHKEVWVGSYGIHPQTYLKGLGITSFPDFCA